MSETEMRYGPRDESVVQEQCDYTINVGFCHVGRWKIGPVMEWECSDNCSHVNHGSEIGPSDVTWSKWCSE